MSKLFPGTANNFEQDLVARWYRDLADLERILGKNHVETTWKRYMLHRLLRGWRGIVFG